MIDNRYTLDTVVLSAVAITVIFTSASTLAIVPLLRMMLDALLALVFGYLAISGRRTGGFLRAARAGQGKGKQDRYAHIVTLMRRTSPSSSI